MPEQFIDILSNLKALSLTITTMAIIVAVFFYFLIKKFGHYNESPFEDYNLKRIFMYCGVIGGGAFILAMFLWIWIIKIT